MGDISRDFNKREFACRCGCGYDSIDGDVVKIAQAVRDALGEAVRINSACRCPAHNRKVGGVSDSYHTQGRAADLSCSLGSKKLFATLRKLFDEGKIPALAYCRHYSGQNFVHVDVGKKRNSRFAE